MRAAACTQDVFLWLLCRCGDKPHCPAFTKHLIIAFCTFCTFCTASLAALWASFLRTGRWHCSRCRRDRRRSAGTSKCGSKHWRTSPHLSSPGLRQRSWRRCASSLLHVRLLGTTWGVVLSVAVRAAAIWHSGCISAGIWPLRWLGLFTRVWCIANRRSVALHCSACRRARQESRGSPALAGSGQEAGAAEGGPAAVPPAVWPGQRGGLRR